MGKKEDEKFIKYLDKKKITRRIGNKRVLKKF